MRLVWAIGWFCLLAGAAVAETAVTPASAFWDQTAARRAEPGLSYLPGEADALPKTILFSAGPEEILADAEEWARRGVRAFFMDYVARDWSSNIWATDAKPWTIGPSDETFQKAKAANDLCREIGSETFLKIAFDNPFEWFNDIAWQQIDHNFRQFAIFARETGCTGIALDIEYIGQQYHFDWPGYTYEGYTRKDLVAKIRQRMTRVLELMYNEFPDMVFLTFPEQGLGLGMHIHAAWVEYAAWRGAPGGIHYCTEYTYRNPNVRYMFAHAWACNEVFQRVLSRKAQRYWTDKCSIAEGIWPFGFDYQSVYDPGMPLDEFRQGYAASLMASGRYNWIYSHNCREQLIGRGLDKYTGPEDLQAYLDVIAKREVIETEPYPALAAELRSMRLRDYSGDFGLIPSISFAGPEDSPVLRLMPVQWTDPEELETHWNLALQYFNGEDIQLGDLFATQREWMLIGPFPSDEGLAGHHVAYPPESEIDLSAAYDGVEGEARWIEHRVEEGRASVDLTRVFSPSEDVCAYALCYVESPEEKQVQLRLATNDSGKVWLGDRLVYDMPGEGTVYLDRDMVPVILPEGITPILIKICNGKLRWGFVFRMTDSTGKPIDDLRFYTRPPGTGSM